ncbi:MAG: MoaD/ThiS family protein [Sphingopyxis sp.]
MAYYTIELCGKLADKLSPSFSHEIDGDHCTVSALRQSLAAAYPALATDMASTRVRACVDEVIVSNDTTVTAGQVIAFFPPVSGG